MTVGSARVVLLTITGPRCISFRCKVTVSLAQGAVHDAEADVADPVFVRSTIHAAIWSKKEDSVRHVWDELDQNTTFSESVDPDALKGPGNGNVGR